MLFLINFYHNNKLRNYNRTLIGLVVTESKLHVWLLMKDISLVVDNECIEYFNQMASNTNVGSLKEYMYLRKERA